MALVKADAHFIDSGIKTGRIYKHLVTHKDRVLVFCCEKTPHSLIIWAIDGYDLALAIPRKRGDSYDALRKAHYEPLIYSLMEEIVDLP